MPIDRKKFFERWRTEMVRYMTLVEILPEGYLYYYEARDCCIWVVVGPHEVLVAYNWSENPLEIREKVHLAASTQQQSVTRQFLDLLAT